MSNDFERRFEEAQKRRESAARDAERRSAAIAVVVGAGAIACSDEIERFLAQDSRVVGSFRNITKRVLGDNFEVAAESRPMKVRFKGSVSYNPAADINPSHQGPAWTAIFPNILLQATPNEPPLRHVQRRIEARFSTVGRPEMHLWAALQEVQGELEGEEPR